MERMGKEFRLNNVSVERHAAKMLGVDRCSDVIRNHRERPVVPVIVTMP